MHTPTSLGEWLKERRSVLDLTQEELADLVGCSWEMVRKIETGVRRPSKQMAELLAEALGIGPEDLRTFMRLARAGQDQTRPSSPTSVRLPSNLQAMSTLCIGREAEISAAQSLLSQEHVRLVTITGVGGSGKTRLALEVLSRLLSESERLTMELFPDGMYLVRLEALSDPSFIVPAIADAVSLELHGQDEPALQVQRHLREKACLLVLDNFEHLTNGAHLLLSILDHCPQVKLLITSQEPLKVTGEWVLAVGGLSLPRDGSRAALVKSGAGQLFVQRARQLQATFEPTGEDVKAIGKICRMVGSLPLAIEMAATWVRMLPCVEIGLEIERSLDFLNTTARDVPVRQRSVRAVFDYCWQTLSDEEQRVFRQLTVFQGGFGRQAAAEVVGATLPVLASLVDRSLLLVMPGGRYERHMLLFQFAHEKLVEAPAERQAVEEGHSAYFVQFLEQRREILRGPQVQRTMSEMDAEIENIRLAWRWAVEHDRVDDIARCAESLECFYDTHGWYREGEKAFSLAVARLRALTYGGNGGETSLFDATAVHATLAVALTHQASFIARQGHLEDATKLLAEAIPMLRAVGADKETAYALQQLGMVTGQRGEYAEAGRYLEESLVLGRGSGDRRGVMRALNMLGLNASKLGEWAESRAKYEACLCLAHELGDRRMRALTLNYMGYMLCLAQQPAEARPFLLESLAIAQELGDSGLIPYILGSLGQAAYALGHLEEARQRSLESLDMSREVGDMVIATYDLLRLGDIACARGDHTEGESFYKQALRAAIETAALPRVLSAVTGLARIRELRQDPVGAVELLAWPLVHPSTEQADKGLVARLFERLRATVGEEAARMALERGGCRPMIEVIQTLLGTSATRGLSALLEVPEFEVLLDPGKQARTVEEITNSGFFAHLADKAGVLRLDLGLSGEV